MTHTAEMESDAHGVHHHEKEAFDSLFRNHCVWIPIKYTVSFYGEIMTSYCAMKTFIVIRAFNFN